MAKFKIGDRVRFVKGNALADATGTIVGNGDGYYAWSVRLDKRSVDFGHTCDGLVDDFFGRYAKDADLEPVAVAQQPQLTIRAGRYYRTRDGRKVGPMERASDGVKWTPNDGRHWYNDNGTRTFGEDDGTVIVAEWVDEPAVEETKFKVGDEVAYVKPKFGTAKVVEIVDDNHVMVDTRGVYRICTENVKDLRLVAPATSGKPAIVAIIENGQPKPATRPFVHPDRDSAAKEARRLAGQHKGKEFGVYELVDTAKEERVYEHEWQRLAAEGQKVNAIRELKLSTGMTLFGAKTAVESWLTFSEAA